MMLQLQVSVSFGKLESNSREFLGCNSQSLMPKGPRVGEKFFERGSEPATHQLEDQESSVISP